MADIIVGGGRYNHTQLLKNLHPSVPYGREGVPDGVTRILVGGPSGYKIYAGASRDGTWEWFYDYTADDMAIIAAADDTDDGDGDGDGDTDTKPPEFPPTGPVFTPLDPAGIAQRNYTPFYPQSYMPADPAYPSMGLLSQPAFGGTDLYQPWSAKYGENVAPSNLWNYEPPSGLDVGPGPKVGYVK